MPRHKRFEEHRWLGDKRSQVVHDVDAESECPIDEIVAAQAGTCFGPDLLAEARNRGYQPCGSCAPKHRWTDRSPN